MWGVMSCQTVLIFPPRPYHISSSFTWHFTAETWCCRLPSARNFLNVQNGGQFTAYLHPPGGSRGHLDDLIFTSLLELQSNSDTIKCHASRVRRTAAFFKNGENYISDKTCGTGGGKDDERETPCWNSYYHPSPPPPPIYQKRSLAHLTPSHQTKSNPRIAKTESTSGSRYWIPEGVRCPDDGSAIPSCEFSSCFTSSVKPWGAVQCPLYLTKKMMTCLKQS